MQIYPILYTPQNRFTPSNTQTQDLNVLISQIGAKTLLPDKTRNYSILNQELVKNILAYRENAIAPMMRFLSAANDERQVTEGLYILDRMIDAGIQGVETAYPVISRFNRTNSPNIQVMLSGIYRKTQIPDAFGPLLSMLITNTFYPPCVSFDPNEEIGGAILEYLRNSASNQAYNNF